MKGVDADREGEGDENEDYVSQSTSIYKLARKIKQRDNTVYNSLRSIYEDSSFVQEIRLLWPSLPVLANLRCGLWYLPQFNDHCYFKSTDGHTGNWSFSCTRLNMNVAHTAAQHGGCILVDATRKGKKFPDSMSKTIPIWCCVLNRAVRNVRLRAKGRDWSNRSDKSSNSNGSGGRPPQLARSAGASASIGTSTSTSTSTSMSASTGTSTSTSTSTSASASTSTSASSSTSAFSKAPQLGGDCDASSAEWESGAAPEAGASVHGTATATATDVNASAGATADAHAHARADGHGHASASASADANADASSRANAGAVDEDASEGAEASTCGAAAAEPRDEWDCSLHMPLWVSDSERAQIESRLDRWVGDFEATGADLTALTETLKKPLQPLWVSQRTVVWLNEVPDPESWPFTAVVQVSASRQAATPQRMSDSEFGWTYIPGAADDEESWARGLTPGAFWKHSGELVRGGPAGCNRRVAEIVEHDRVQRAMRGDHAPQVRVRKGAAAAVPGGQEEFQSQVNIGQHWSTWGQLMSGAEAPPSSGVGPGGKRREPSVPGQEDPAELEPPLSWNHEEELEAGRSAILAPHGDSPQRPPGLGAIPLTEASGVNEPRHRKDVLRDELAGFHWIGHTGLAVGNADCGRPPRVWTLVDAVINCGAEEHPDMAQHKDRYLYLPVVSSKVNRQSLGSHLGEAIAFCQAQLRCGRTVLLHCSDGADLSACTCLAVLMSSFDDNGKFSGGASSEEVTKGSLRKWLTILSAHDTDARPSRGNLKQVYNCLADATQKQKPA